jgi:membrane protein
MPPRIDRLLGFARFLARRYHEDRCSQVAANLTFTTLLALVPMVTIAITVISAFPAFEEFMIEVKSFILKNLVPDVASKIIGDYMEQFSQKATGLTMVGIAMLAVTSLMLMFTIENAFNTIWRTRRSRPLVHRFMIYWAMLTLGPILIGASISLTSYLVGLSKGWVSVVPEASELLLKIVPIVLTMVAFSLLYHKVPNRFVPQQHALAGGLIAAIMFELMKRVFATYLISVPTYSLVYGAFASFPIFLVWVYSSWLVILVGAVITASLPYWRDDAWRAKETPRQRLHDALRVLRVLSLAHKEGRPASLASLRRSVPVALEQLEDLLERLVDSGLVTKSADKGYFLVKRPEEIRLSDIYRLFILESHPDVQIVNTDEELGALIAKISEDVEENLGLTLGTIFTREGGDTGSS